MRTASVDVFVAFIVERQTASLDESSWTSTGVIHTSRMTKGRVRCDHKCSSSNTGSAEYGKSTRPREPHWKNDGAECNK
ncbi:hypothetical protein PILCRDRAFT_826601 [Piloderma croceum F 1598]|uniref:Uncharacterized protein n=1 Tax=Piloderma croceum (strain F 1598) TaxID=765440 RepID=A0A0C3BFW0_PILCF|nr:hypothetical protein PILCRDRAFT_826601 [Piloderma croceum F 1598]